jgi:hypothetical protein
MISTANVIVSTAACDYVRNSMVGGEAMIA